jgi:hypothetical protein
MSQTKITCIERYATLTGGYDDLVDFMLEEKLMTQSQIAEFKKETQKALYLWKLLVAECDNKIMLLDFEWSLLPIERLKITIVTDRTSRSFGFNHV